MVLDEQNAHKYVNRKYFPVLLGSTLCGLTVLLNLIFFFMGNSNLMISMAGIEILLYMLLNCVGGLIVSKIGPYFKKTAIVFIINLIIVFGVIYLLLGSELSKYKEYSPILEAFIFSFFGSFMLVIIIRNVINFLKE